MLAQNLVSGGFFSQHGETTSSQVKGKRIKVFKAFQIMLVVTQSLYFLIHWWSDTNAKMPESKSKKIKLKSSETVGGWMPTVKKALFLSRSSFFADIGQRGVV